MRGGGVEGLIICHVLESDITFEALVKLGGLCELWASKECRPIPPGLPPSCTKAPSIPPNFTGALSALEESRKLKPSGVSVNCVLVALLAVPAAFDEALELGLLGDLATCRLGLSTRRSTCSSLRCQYLYFCTSKASKPQLHPQSLLALANVCSLTCHICSSRRHLPDVGQRADLSQRCLRA